MKLSDMIIAGKPGAQQTHSEWSQLSPIKKLAWIKDETLPNRIDCVLLVILMLVFFFCVCEWLPWQSHQKHYFVVSLKFIVFIAKNEYKMIAVVLNSLKSFRPIFNHQNHL